jgi:Interferon-induced transmembrane protein
MSYSPMPGGTGQPGQSAGPYQGPGPWPSYGLPVPGERPPDYKVWVTATIIAGVLFSVILGLPAALAALVYSRKVRSCWADGDLQGASSAARTARVLAIAATCLDALGFILVSVIISRGGHTAGWM